MKKGKIFSPEEVSGCVSFYDGRDDVPDYAIEADGIGYGILPPVESRSLVVLGRGYKAGKKEEIIIPSVVKDEEGVEWTVTAINHKAFFEDFSIISILIPDTVTVIGATAFGGCSKLQKVVLSQRLTQIRPQTFKDCSSLASLDIPQSVTSIYQYAFENCRSLTSIFIPRGVTYLNIWGLFDGCRSLEAIEVDSSNGSYASWDGLLYTKRFDELLACPAARKQVVLPGSLKKINDFAFLKCRQLKCITLPAGLTEIGDKAFNYCKELEEINVDEGNVVFAAVDGALYNKSCTTLLRCPIGKTSLTMPTTVQKVMPLALRDCKDLISVVCPAPVPPKSRPLSLSEATLYVPADSLDAYANAEFGKGFGAIESL